MIVLLNKPFNVLCQFTDSEGRATLGDYVKIPNIYPAGRLDYDSEGLLILTDEGKIASRITEPRFKMPKTYLAQVEGNPTPLQLDQLSCGVALNDGFTQPALSRILPSDPAWLWPRSPPIRLRKLIPTCWIELTICEGRNRQVRRMTAAVGLPTLRLIRVRIGNYELRDLQSGEIRVVAQ